MCCVFQLAWSLVGGGRSVKWGGKTNKVSRNVRGHERDGMSKKNVRVSFGSMTARTPSVQSLVITHRDPPPTFTGWCTMSWVLMLLFHAGADPENTDFIQNQIEKLADGVSNSKNTH